MRLLFVFVVFLCAREIYQSRCINYNLLFIPIGLVPFSIKHVEFAIDYIFFFFGFLASLSFHKIGDLKKERLAR